MTEPREQRPVTALRGVGEALAARLAVLGVEQVQDLLFILPTRYEDRTRIQPIGALLAGGRAVIEGEVQLTEVVFRRRRQMLCRIADGSGFLTLRFFHFSTSQQQGLARGHRIRCFGEVRRGPLGLEMVHPEYRRVFDTDAALEESLTPVYPATEGVSQGRLRALIGQALREVETAGVRDWLPAPLLAPLGLPELRDALRQVHRPPVDVELEELEAGRHPAQRRLAFEELLTHQVVMRRLRETATADPAWPLQDAAGLENRFIAGLPYALTGAQQRALADIAQDLSLDRPMVRLVQGDVGCGKTAVAAAAAARAIGSGHQAALMAPTELLAEQHQRNLAAWFAPLGIEVILVSGSQPARTRRSALELVANGTARLVVGTHALFQDGMQFADLALVIVDEQHRFGVHQRMALREKGLQPHQLIMTATPIPRTLTMAMYADMSVSVIDELPRGRQPITTRAVPTTKREEVMRLLRQVLAARAQAYWVCPLIEEGEIPGLAAATTVAAELAAELPEFSTGLLHGRLSTAEKAEVMSRFKSGEIDLLVATTVVEVGVDVPNATLMVIENPERLGLAQLHQLRGRVGRGSRPSTCLLFYAPPLGAVAQARLATIRETQDGFLIAERDLALRGPGEVLGTRQTGEVGFRVADLGEHAPLLPTALARADELLAAGDPAIQVLLSAWAPAERGASNV